MVPNDDAVARRAARPIQLALQGGGAHGALTWGVLDRLLEAPDLEIRAVSGTSAGAMNAVVLADGLRRGGRDGARRALADFWRAVSRAAVFSPLRRGLLDRLAGRDGLDRSPGFLMLEGLARVFSPGELNPLGLNPLRDLLAARVDFAALADHGGVAVHVTATDVRTGLPRVFAGDAVTADAVMASACLPQLYPAVEIDGEAYWDGGFAGNPALMPLVARPDRGDILIVQLNPLVRREVPRRARDIINRMNEITFNACLLKELEAIDRQRRRGDAGARDLRLHVIDAGSAGELAASGKLDAEWRHLSTLFERGRARAESWLAEHGAAIGHAATLDLSALFGAPAAAPAGRGWRRLMPARVANRHRIDSVR